MAEKKDGQVTVTKSGKRVRYVSFEEMERRLQEKEYPEAASYIEEVEQAMAPQQPGQEQ